ncbi:hypothetical protein [Ensifer sp. B1-9]|uniref:hypothetical protein n=1 Tax=Ensifer sp. B1-9 TaxID=3141455 RepID=UPI003D1D88EA
MLVNDGFRAHGKTTRIMSRAPILKESLQPHGTGPWIRLVRFTHQSIGNIVIEKEIMASAYAVAPIKAAQVERAYCLIRAVGYRIDLDAWRQICATALLRTYPSPYVEEIAVVENSLDYVRGIAILRARYSERLGRYLSVPVFVIASAGDTPGVCDALLQYLRATARDRHCGAIHIASLTPDRWPVANGTPEREADGIFIPLR